MKGEARQKLLDAAMTLFADRPYARTTTRDIADAAGVDATLIARYFGSKAGLYLATLKVELVDDPADLLDPSRMKALLGRVVDRGPGPVFQSAVAPHEDEQVQAEARAALHARLVEPLRARLAQNQVEDPWLQAELITAAFAGIALGLTSGTFPELQKLPPDELVSRVRALLSPRTPGRES